jgi:LacI family transcriptional regulator
MQAGNGHATMADVAREAGVSLKSVSRVINGEPHVTPRLRDKVEVAIRALDYVPDTAARSLAGARSFTIGVLFDHPNPSYAMKVIGGVYRACVESQYHLRIDHIGAVIDDAELLMQVDRIMRHGRTDGLVLPPPLVDNPRLLDMLDARGMRYVRIAPVFEPERSMAVEMDDVAAAAAVADLLLDHGHRRIGLINGPAHHGAAARRRQGFLDRMQARGLAVSVVEADGRFTFDGGMAAANDLLAGAGAPTAIFATNDDSAAGAIVACNQRGLKVPEQVSVCGFDDSWIAKSVWPPLTTIHQPIEEMAHMAAAMLLDRTLGVEDRPVRQLGFGVVIRDSVGVCSASPS